ncbi:MAG TPA: nuclear transport factor 2 family protein, partial [Acidimicrobiales bacterium]|nr:nuclear transport factor 2 family protein [Acidimicrobiales bacterium]
MSEGFKTPREMSQMSMRAVAGKDKQGWLDLFADDGVVEDPVGPSMFDPEGKGHHGKQAIGAFFDMTIAINEKIEFDIRNSYECADEVANVGEITITLAGGQRARVGGVFVYKVNGKGKLASLRAFWEADKIEFLDADDADDAD